ncbi:MAG TPA: DVUA0089 family protein [Bryobacteraceae bacterium]|nr:DVUA0089 family protein [Bryobacteraceae bacterium]
MSRGLWLCVLTTTLLALPAASPLVASPLSFSYTGLFTQDDNIQLFSFAIGATAAVTIQTWSFAGGTNAASTVIPAGGFAPVLSLFDGTGNVLATDKNDNSGTCGPRNVDPASGFCWDAYLNPTLSAGKYTVALTEDDNVPIGPTFGDGFSEQGNGNFTGPLFLGPVGDGKSFILADGEQRTPGWAVDIVGVDTASQIPEPAPAWLCAAGLVVALALRRLTWRRD